MEQCTELWIHTELRQSACVNHASAPAAITAPLAAKRGLQAKPASHSLLGVCWPCCSLEEAWVGGVAFTQQWHISTCCHFEGQVDIFLSSCWFPELSRLSGPVFSTGAGSSPLVPGLDLVCNIPLSFLAPLLEWPTMCVCQHRFPHLAEWEEGLSMDIFHKIFLSYFHFLSNRVPLVLPAKKERYVSGTADSCPVTFAYKHAYCIFQWWISLNFKCCIIFLYYSQEKEENWVQKVLKDPMGQLELQGSQDTQGPWAIRGSRAFLASQANRGLL